jgi:hypothetical protein
VRQGIGLLMGAMAVALLLAAAGWAQQAAQPVWQGVLRNEGGALLSGARVRLSGGGKHAEAMSGADGHFRLAALPEGHYRLTVSVGRRTAEYAEPIDLAAGAEAVAVTLSARGELTVAALEGQAATGGEKLSSQQVSELPLNTRDFGTLLLLAAGTMTDANGATNFTAQFAINGQRGAEATFAMDGADISDPEMGGATFSNFNVDAIESVDSSSGWMPAEIGRGASGFTNIHTRSGASGFHGSFFEFLRNSALDARNYFDHATPAYPGRIPPFRRNEFGFTNGGPVLLPHMYDGRGRTFYFVEYQGFRQVLGTTQVMPVPSAVQRPTGGSNIVNDTVTYPNGATDTLMVPVDPKIAAVLKRYPLPNLPSGAYGANTYATASSVATDADQVSLRIDQRITPKDQFLARFTLDNITGPTTNPDQTALDPSFGVQYFDRERNVVGRYTRTVSPQMTLVSSLSITRSTPGFPTPNTVDPAVRFNNGLFESFNSAAGSVMQSYGNLFQGQQSVEYLTGNHAIKAGFEARLNRDSTYYGSSPNGDYDFGGGTAYSTEPIASVSGTHNLAVGDPLPDTFSAFLSGSVFDYWTVLAPWPFSGGQHIAPAAISRNNFNAYVEDTWKVTPRFTLAYGLRWEFYTPITERAHRTGGLMMANGVQEYVINPQPGYRTQWNGWGPRVQASWQLAPGLVAHAGGAITVIPPNIWQDNMLTGATPISIYPRVLSSASAPTRYGFQITSAELPPIYTPGGAVIFASGDPKRVAPNTVMDLDRYEKGIAALTPGGTGGTLNLNVMDRGFGNATLYTWTAGLEQKLGNLTADASYIGTAAEKLPREIFPNGYPGASPAFAPETEFDSAGNIVGGFGVINETVATAHSTYHALQTSLSGTAGHRGPGIQAGYTWSKSIDDTSQVIGGTGSTGAVANPVPQNPYDTHPEKGPSAFDVTHSFALSLAQDLQLERVEWLEPVSRKATAGWELLSISTITSGSPFTVYSGIQQTGAGSFGVDRPDQIAMPHLSTARANREDYFGAGADNATDYFSIPIHVAGGTGPNQGRFGTLGRNSFRGPAYYDFDFALIKDTPFGTRPGGAQRTDLQFRAEFFNLFNIVDMGLPANILNGAGFGEISKTAGNSRQIQVSLKLIY